MNSLQIQTRFILVLLFSSIILFFQGDVRASVAPPTDKPKGVVFVKKIETAPLFDQLIYPAKVIPQINTTILAEADGIVSKILTPLGQSVKNHERVMVISHIDPVYQYAPMAVVAPVNGIVSSMDVTEGTQIAKGQKLASVTDPAKIKISVEIPAQDLSMVKRGLSGEFRPMGSNEIIPVKIRGVSPFVDPATGTASAEIEIDKKNKNKILLSPGLLGQVSFKANEHSGINIPDYALFYKGQNTFVRVIDGDKAKQVAVVLGKKQRGFVEILKGLEPNAILVERASRYVGDGESVTVESTENTGAQN